MTSFQKNMNINEFHFITCESQLFLSGGKSSQGSLLTAYQLSLSLVDVTNTGPLVVSNWVSPPQSHLINLKHFLNYYREYTSNYN